MMISDSKMTGTPLRKRGTRWIWDAWTAATIPWMEAPSGSVDLRTVGGFFLPFFSQFGHIQTHDNTIIGKNPPHTQHCANHPHSVKSCPHRRLRLHITIKKVAPSWRIRRCGWRCGARRCRASRRSWSCVSRDTFLPRQKWSTGPRFRCRGRTCSWVWTS